MQNKNYVVFLIFQFQWSAHKIYTIFKKYGRIEFVEKRGYNHHYRLGYWNIQFESAQVTIQLLTKRQMVIDNIKINIDIPIFDRNLIDSKPFIAVICEILLQPPDEESPTNICNALNDDCLRKIFKKLDLVDICSVADVCLRFNRIAKEIPVLKYRNNEFSFEYLYRNYYTLAQIEDFLRKFGSLITWISTTKDDWYPNSIIVLGMCNEYCVNVNQIEYSIRESTEFMRDRNSTGVQLFNEIFTLLSRLKKLKVSIERSCIHTKIFDYITEHGSNIQELDFGRCVFLVRTFEQDIIRLSQLNNLKKFSCSFRRCSIAPLMQAFASQNVPIECLDVNEGIIDNDAIQFISQIKTISKLHFARSINLNDKHLIDLACNLPNLVNLSIFKRCTSPTQTEITINGIKKLLQHGNQLSKLILDEPIKRINDFDEIMRIIKSRNNGIKLNIELHSIVEKNIPAKKLSKIDLYFFQQVPQALLDKYSDYLTVNIY